MTGVRPLPAPPAVQSNRLRCSSRDIAGVRVVFLAGEADHHDRGRLRDALGDAVATGRPVLVDLGELSFMSAGALGILLEVRAACTRRGFALSGPRGAVSRLLEASGTLGRFRVYPSRWAALSEQIQRAA